MNQCKHMSQFLSFLIICLATAGCSALFFGPKPEWDALKVRWGINPLTSFKNQPRTIDDAKSEGYTATDGDACKSDGAYRGVRYIMNDDPALMLLFDRNGFIAGIQSALPKDKSLNFPTPQLKFKGMLHEESNKYTETFYFTHPDKICSEGRTQAEFDRDGTGRSLFLQSGPNPSTDLIQIPNSQADMDKTKWTQTKCFYTMGMHYWYNLTADMNCDNILPAFAIYNKGRLNAFGFAFGTYVESSRYEHPPQRVFERFLKPVPQCLYEQATRNGGLTTMHVFLSSWPLLNRC
ncbi:uncharacterized protein LOC141912883 [Tubulanus polymorphus]|uniref:uncharacterized protein LOC141912883 n=1 Tax=Tubulanus polymorphus TaxID=672921 RepID=UPI003DA28C04